MDKFDILLITLFEIDIIFKSSISMVACIRIKIIRALKFTIIIKMTLQLIGLYILISEVYKSKFNLNIFEWSTKVESNLFSIQSESSIIQNHFITRMIYHKVALPLKVRQELTNFARLKRIHIHNAKFAITRKLSLFSLQILTLYNSSNISITRTEYDLCNLIEKGKFRTEFKRTFCWPKDDAMRAGYARGTGYRMAGTSQNYARYYKYPSRICTMRSNPVNKQ